MKNLPRIILESFRQAFQSLISNKLRSFLSLLGISIGIFCIIGVLSAVDSLKDNISASFDTLGQDVIYVNRFSWTEDPGQNYWKWMKRPQPTYKDYKAIKDKVKTARLVGLFTNIGRQTIKFRSNSVEGGEVAGIMPDNGELMGFRYEDGRYFSRMEMQTGANKVILGYVVAEELFGSIPPVGKKIKVGARKLEVIGVLEKSGESLINFLDFDESLMIPYSLAKKYANLEEGHGYGGAITVKANDGIDLEDLKGEMQSALRIRRKLRPRADNNFALNEISILKNGLDQVFTAVNIAGGFIGLFALLVGMFSVANIMFVSVKERTNLIGVKKALGAKSHVILLEFLIEAMVLCLIGGIMGILIIGLGFYGISQAINFELYVDQGNVFTGLFVSLLTGLLAGIIPAYQAARLDPVVAMRG